MISQSASVGVVPLVLLAVIALTSPAIAVDLPPGFVQGDVVSYSYVPNKTWTLQEGKGKLPYLFEYALMKWRGKEPLEDFHEENIQRIDLASRWSTCVMLTERMPEWRDELIRLMLRCYRNRQLIILADYWAPKPKRTPEAFDNTLAILNTLWENRDTPIRNAEGDEATGRQLINNILMVKLGDEGLGAYTTADLEGANTLFKTKIQEREIDNEQPFRHIKTWYNLVGYGLGTHAAAQEDITQHKRLLIPSNAQYIGVDTYHYWDWNFSVPNPAMISSEERMVVANQWQDIITRFHPEGLRVRSGEGWNAAAKNDTHAMIQAIELAGAKEAMMVFIANSSNTQGSYTTPIETMDAYYDSLKAGPWVGLSWWVWDWDNSDGFLTRCYMDGTLKEFTPENKEGSLYPPEKQAEFRERFLASRHRMFEDTVYNQFGHINPRPAITGEARR